MDRFVANTAQRRKRWKQVEIDSDRAFRGDAPLRNWIISTSFGVFFAFCLVLLAAFIATIPPDLPSPASIAKQLRLSTSEALASLGILATVIVALAFARSKFSPNGAETMLESRMNVRLAFVGPLLGAFATSIALLSLFSRFDTDQADMLLKLIIFMLSQVIAFVAAQIQLDRDEAAFVAARELPIYKARHTLLEEDQRERWRFRRDPLSRPKGLWVVLAGLFPIGAFAFIAPAFLQQFSDAYANLFLVWLLGMVLTLLFCLLPAPLLWHTRWTFWSVPIAAVGTAIPIVLVIWFASSYEKHNMRNETDYSVAGLATISLLLILLELTAIWPFFVIRYPQCTNHRRFLIRASYPIHLLRWHILSSSRKTRLMAISRRESGYGR